MTEPALSPEAEQAVREAARRVVKVLDEHCGIVGLDPHAEELYAALLPVMRDDWITLALRVQEAATRAERERVARALIREVRALRGEVERFRYASDKQAVAWKERALKAEAAYGRTLEGARGR